MAGSDMVRRCARPWQALGWTCALVLVFCARQVLAQLPDEAFGERTVAEVKLVGNRTVSEKDIRAKINTRAGRPFDPVLAQKDARDLVATNKFFDVRVKTQPGPAPGTVIVVFEVLEFPKLGYIHIVGNETIKTKILEKEAGLKVGDSYSLSAVDEARQKLEAFYRNHGYNQVRVEVPKGMDSKDGGVAFVINEGPAQKIWSVQFIGNKIVSGERLKTFIESKPGILKYIKGYVDTRKIEEDVVKLTAYYRSLGYFKARIGRELKYDDSGKWLYLTFVIDEGPRFTVRSISFSGNRLFNEEQLRPLVALNQGDHFEQGKMTKSISSLTDAYGGVGYVMAKVEASPRTLESEPQLDLVYEITEGKRYRIGKINVTINGENAHTRKEVALNRLSFRPGEIADIRKIRDSERRLRASAVFANDPANRPQIQLVRFNEEEQTERTAAPKPKSVRGQSPDDVQTRECYSIQLDVDGGGRKEAASGQWPVINGQAVGTQYSVPSTQYPVLSTKSSASGQWPTYPHDGAANQSETLAGGQP